ncbi:MAG: TonB-dependent receptor plug domain-containing protein, partial [bacterium]|nr:TonB-dependent receptor plug domain-containing protein [bacterium]
MENSNRLVYAKAFKHNSLQHLSTLAFLGLSTSLLWTSPVFAESEANHKKTVVVTASRIPTEISAVGNSVSIISAEDIQRMGARTVNDVLRHIPGLDVVRSGGDGQTSSVFIRGAKSEQTLVLLDGAELNDPGSPARGFNFANLTTDNIERIEILRGAGSPVYGSDAMGGVINIITKRGKPGASTVVSAEAGSYGTFREKASVSA